MIEAMEQQIINSINNKWTKDRDKRREIDIDNISETFRVICSSRATILTIIESLKESNNNENKILELKENMIRIYDWITEDSIQNIILKYNTSLKDKGKEADYKLQIPEIKEDLQVLKENIIMKTLDKLFLFHKIIGWD